ncbi:hypothetical protein Csa_015087 [Cucumis sativus]|uniref:Uncharacterized protein n=1 Tax=Cucumis sativus TaxID=3659 RepID=A0A0A0KVC4_CUCSA|nr:hypothetical protein Csa_015087 [Cucumis sativus]
MRNRSVVETLNLRFGKNLPEARSEERIDGERGRVIFGGISESVISVGLFDPETLRDNPNHLK